MTTVNLAVVARHLNQLEAAFGNENAFVKAFTAMKADADMKAPEAKRLAREFAKQTARSKTKAFAAIWSRHHSLMRARAKNAALFARTAA
ncbi:hypothetical protein SAMN04488061_2863 [Filomicrobium insigne]|uniref:Uncharacterized protein n=1 Tax=Filomicrobium insigne TaxID=418854 RepID=A0A1H0SEK8_9HYPH|nr:hypothetical protein [Filomicrobium insigne]SDP40154.1 hypothetical protein SAMN04488061_2863 [Filomicrobium insigne]